MLGKTHKIRRTGILVALGAAIAAFAVPAALGSGFDGRSPDTKDAAAQASSQSQNPGDGWYYRFVPLREPTAGVVLDGRSPDTKDAAAQAQLQSHNPGDGWYYRALSPQRQGSAIVVAPLDGRSPDTKDAALNARYQSVSIVEGRGFDWGDFGIGIAAAVGGLLLLAGLGAGLREMRQMRHRLGNA